LITPLGIHSDRRVLFVHAWPKFSEAKGDTPRHACFPPCACYAPGGSSRDGSTIDRAIAPKSFSAFFNEWIMKRHPTWIPVSVVLYRYAGHAYVTVWVWVSAGDSEHPESGLLTPVHLCLDWEFNAAQRSADAQAVVRERERLDRITTGGFLELCNLMPDEEDEEKKKKEKKVEKLSRGDRAILKVFERKQREYEADKLKREASAAAALKLKAEEKVETEKDEAKDSMFSVVLFKKRVVPGVFNGLESMIPQFEGFMDETMVNQFVYTCVHCGRVAAANSLAKIPKKDMIACAYCRVVHMCNRPACRSTAVQTHAAVCPGVELFVRGAVSERTVWAAITTKTQRIQCGQSWDLYMDRQGAAKRAIQDKVERLVAAERKRMSPRFIKLLFTHYTDMTADDRRFMLHETRLQEKRNRDDRLEVERYRREVAACMERGIPGEIVSDST